MGRILSFLGLIVVSIILYKVFGTPIGEGLCFILLGTIYGSINTVMVIDDKKSI